LGRIVRSEGARRGGAAAIRLCVRSDALRSDARTCQPPSDLRAYQPFLGQSRSCRPMSQTKRAGTFSFRPSVSLNGAPKPAKHRHRVATDISAPGSFWTPGLLLRDTSRFRTQRDRPQDWSLRVGRRRPYEPLQGTGISWPTLAESPRENSWSLFVSLSQTRFLGSLDNRSNRFCTRFARRATLKCIKCKNYVQFRACVFVRQSARRLFRCRAAASGAQGPLLHCAVRPRGDPVIRAWPPRRLAYLMLAAWQA
jgi:hypothetical protein